MDLILISGLSGAGKSVALRFLEDNGYYCVDNLPGSLLQLMVKELREQGRDKVAVAMDMRGGHTIDHLPVQLAALQGWGLSPRFLFLDAKDETLLKRFSETRRRHPLARDDRSLIESIQDERRQLEGIATLGHRIDTSDFKANALREWVRQFAELEPESGLTLMFQSFGFKHGIPLDADLVFDVRCLPNPYYDPELRALTGRDAGVIDFLEAETEVRRMREDIKHFIASWLPAYLRDNRAYLTVGIGCTGGQHRSVYLAEWLGKAFADQVRVLVRHRSLAGW
jgi:UPF0042 nucleotide-binding protein